MPPSTTPPSVAVQTAAPRSAYIHVPFCRHRCGYCNFTLVAGRDDLIPRYLDALGRELLRLGKPRPVETLFLGGGTPTHLAAGLFEELLQLVLQWHPLLSGGELTVEANPEDVDAARVDVMRRMGVSRVSLGAQSFDRAKLALLERGHTADTIGQAVGRCRDIPATVSLDLIFASPGERGEVWRSDLAAAVALRPEHVSTYGLTVERGTAFWSRRHKGELTELADEAWRARYETSIAYLVEAGYEHYEVSSFARPGHRCRHNETYWTGAGYYAAGAGAARFVHGVRETNHRSVTTYIKKLFGGESPVAEREQLTPESYARECLVFGLRRREGIRHREFQDRTGFDLYALAGSPLQEYTRRGWLADDGQRLWLTADGLPISDAIWPAFL